MFLIVDRSKNNEGMPKCHAMNTFFYPKLSGQSYESVRRWTKKVDIFSLDLVFYPIHLGVHWTLAVSTIYIRPVQISLTFKIKHAVYQNYQGKGH